MIVKIKQIEGLQSTLDDKVEGAGTGTTNYVTKWSSSTTITDSIIYDDGTNVGIGQVSPIYKLDVLGDAQVAKDDRVNGALLNITNTYIGSDWIAGDIIGTLNFNVTDPSTTEPTRGSIQVLSTGGSTYPSLSSMVFSTTNGNTKAEAMRIRYDGNVGIGTTNPTEKLDVNGSIISRNAQGDILLRDDASSMDFTRPGTNYFRATGAGGNFAFTTNGTGYATPLLSLNTNSIVINNNTQNYDTIIKGQTDSNLIYVDASTDRVGIGTSSPSSKLHVSGTGLSATFGDSSFLDYWINIRDSVANGIQFGLTTGVGGGAGLIKAGGSRGFGIAVNKSGDFNTIVDADLAFYIDLNDRVGIGTSVPSEKLEVNGNVKTKGALTYLGHGLSTETVGVKIGDARTGDGFSYLDLIGDTTYNTYGLRIIRLNSGANADSQIIHRGTGILTFRATDAGSILFQTSGADRIMINPTGNVGIGTSSPSSKLHVNGSFRLVNGSQANGYILQSDINGVGTWVDPSTIPGDGNGIYSGDGSIPGATSVDLGSDPLRFNSTGLTNLLYIDGSSDRVYVGFSTGSYMLSVREDIYAGSSFNANSSSTRDKYRLSEGTSLYTIGLQSSVSYGALNNTAMTFQMNNTSTMGFWWGDSGHSTAQGAMALTTDGFLTVASGIRAGYGESDTVDPASWMNGTNTNLDIYNHWNLISSGIVSASPGAYGIIAAFGTGTLTAGNLYYLNSSHAWVAADADAASSATGLLGIALGTSPSNGILLQGFARSSAYTQSNGQILYVSTTAGGITNTAPSGSGDIVRIIGYMVNAIADVIYFNPSNDWIEL